MRVGLTHAMHRELDVLDGACESLVSAQTLHGPVTTITKGYTTGAQVTGTRIAWSAPRDLNGKPSEYPGDDYPAGPEGTQPDPSHFV